MSARGKCKRSPQSEWLRKAVFQADLWTGIGLALSHFADERDRLRDTGSGFFLLIN
jgi:hypothetical protein